MTVQRVLKVLIVHGVGWGSGGRAYARPLQRNISDAFEQTIARLRLRKVSRSETRANRALQFQAVYWSTVTQSPQDALISLLRLGGWRALRSINPFYMARKQMVSLLGDVIAYESGPKNSVYAAIHGRVNESVEALARDVTAGERAELTVIGHSLGSVIASDFVWDSTRGADQPYHFRDHPFTVKNMVLLGSPMAVYALRNNPHADRKDIAAALGSPVEVDPDGGLWLNMYDPQDPVGFPLHPIRSYAEMGVIDVPVRAGGRLTSLTPLSHVGYWRCIEVAQAIGRKLALDWAALNEPGFAGARYDKALNTYRKNLR